MASVSPPETDGLGPQNIGACETRLSRYRRLEKMLASEMLITSARPQEKCVCGYLSRILLQGCNKPYLGGKTLKNLKLKAVTLKSSLPGGLPLVKRSKQSQNLNYQKGPKVRLSEYFLPTLKETPAEAQIASHRLMLRAGMVRQASAGIYNWLPLGLKVLQKIENIVRDEQIRSGAQEILMPTIQSAELWKESGRYDDYGKEMLRISDRQDRELLYGPTNEEQITDITRAFIRSYKDLPKNLFQIQWKFRDEIRPRFGVMRGREFLMKDNYSFDLPTTKCFWPTLKPLPGWGCAPSRWPPIQALLAVI